MCERVRAKVRHRGQGGGADQLASGVDGLLPLAAPRVHLQGGLQIAAVRKHVGLRSQRTQAQRVRGRAGRDTESDFHFSFLFPSPCPPRVENIRQEIRSQL